MFHLDHAITEWRRQMTAGGLKNSAVLDELESHLREEIERQTRSGVEEPRAFAIAEQKIGDSDLLKAEFAKVAGGKAARFGKVLGIACCLVALPLPVFALTTFVTARELPAVERALSLVAILLTFLSLASWRFSHNFLPVIRSRRMRSGISFACGLAGLVWLCTFVALLPTVIVPHLVIGSGENLRPAFAMGTAILWAVALTAVLGAIAYGLEGAARRNANKNAYV